MSWTAPRTWVSAEVPTAAIMNAHIRDNLLVQDAAAAQLPSDIIYAGGANSMTERVVTSPGLTGRDGSELVSTGSGMIWRDRWPGTQPYAFSGANYSCANIFVKDLADAGLGPGPGVEVGIETGTQALVYYGARYAGHETAGQNCQLSYRVTGATVAESTAWGIVQEAGTANTIRSVFRVNYHTLNAGYNLFILTIMSSGGLGATLGGPWLMVKPL